MINDKYSKNILVCGDLILDEYLVGQANRISPEAPVPVVKITKTDNKIGGAGNVAMNIKSLGHSPFLISITGSDNAYHQIKKILNNYSIANHIKTLENIQTIQKKRVLCQNQQILRIDFEKDVFPNVQNCLLDEYKEALNFSKIVILSDYLKGTLIECKELIKLAKEKSIPVLVDPKGNNFKKYEGSYLITPNWIEFEAIVGNCKNEIDIENKGRKLLDEFNIENLLITRGEKGFSLIPRKSKSINISAQAQDVYDVTGAGDTFMATLAVSLFENNSLKNSAIKANFASGIVVGKLGTSIVTKKELDSKSYLLRDKVKKIHNFDEIKSIVSNLKSNKINVIMTNGCFDIIHPGHIKYLKKAKNLGGVLFIALNSDDSIKRIKGTKRPINKLSDRMEILSSFEFVDYIFSFSEDTPEKVYDELCPDILVKGGDYKVSNVIGAKRVISGGGQVEIIPFVDGFSTTKMIKKIQEKG